MKYIYIYIYEFKYGYTICRISIHAVSTKLRLDFLDWSALVCRPVNRLGYPVWTSFSRSDRLAMISPTERCCSAGAERDSSSAMSFYRVILRCEYFGIEEHWDFSLKAQEISRTRNSRAQRVHFFLSAMLKKTAIPKLGYHTDETINLTTLRPNCSTMDISLINNTRLPKIFSCSLNVIGLTIIVTTYFSLMQIGFRYTIVNNILYILPRFAELFCNH